MNDVEQDTELLEILKALTDRIKELERAVYHKDNLLMKSGFVVTETPTPSMTNMGVPDSDAIHKMSWEDIDKFVNGGR
jgi:hypothetical protein